MKINMTIAQLSTYIANPEKNIKKINEAVEKAVNDNSDLIIFPELFLHGYYSKDLIYRLAEPIDGKNIKKLKEISRNHDIHIIVGFAERDKKFDIIYNSAVLVMPNEGIQVYRKKHLPDFSVFDEGRYFRRWEGGIELWGIRGFPIGIIICYDIFYPELSRAYMYLGAKGIVIISATPDFSKPLFHILSEARAVENTLYTIWVNMVGTYNGVGFAGESRIVMPLGQILYQAPPLEEDIKTIEVDDKEVAIARQKRPILREVSRADIELMFKSYLLNIKSDINNGEK